MPGLRNLAKQSVFWTYVHLVRPIPRRVLGVRRRQRVIVLAYHRVNDGPPDPLTIAIDQFDEQMAWLKRCHPVVGLDEIVRGDVPRGSKRPIVAVTFDDGYRDNFENAVPILLEHEIPATFFVSTGMIGTDEPFQHDLDVLGHGLPSMTWEHLQRMRELGFSIGSHTVTHLNCAKSDLKRVGQELGESRDTLRRKLGLRDLTFAYPFGGRDDISPEPLRLVKEAGYVACLSAYGGYNSSDAIDRYDIRRVCLNGDFSMLAFRARLEGFSR